MKSNREAVELKMRHIEGRAEKNRSQGVGEHRAILPSIALQKHAKAHESLS